MPSYDTSPRYTLKLLCVSCGHKYRRIVRSLGDPDPPCPRCSAAPTPPRGMDFSSHRAPARGGSAIGKARDFAESEAARQISATDLRTPHRPGDTMAPRLPAAQQAQADAFFSGGRFGGGPRRPSQPDRPQPALNPTTLAAVNSGAFANNPDAQFVAALVSQRRKPPVNYVNIRERR